MWSFTAGLLSTGDILARTRDAARKRRIALDLTQAELATRSGVTPASLKRFERTGEIAFASLVRIAQALDCADGFGSLFPEPEAASLDALLAPTKARRRARRKS